MFWSNTPTSVKFSIRLKTMCGANSLVALRITERSSATPTTRTSCPITWSVFLTSNSVFHGTEMSYLLSSSGGTR